MEEQEEQNDFPSNCEDNTCYKCYKCYQAYVEEKTSGDLD